MPTIFTGLDLETTGLLTPDHRIVELCLDVWRQHDDLRRERLKTYTWRVDPERAIDAKAQKVHGISLEMLKGAPKWPAIAPTVMKVLAITDVLIAHNGEDFDFPFLAQELGREGLEFPEQIVGFDTMQRGRWATAMGKVPNLGELAFACDVPYENGTGDAAAAGEGRRAHAADYDTLVMMDCFWKGIDLGFYKVGRPALPVAA